MISPKKKVKKQESKPVFYLGLQEAEILGTNEAFQPKLRLENIYDNPERWTSMQLPPLPRKSSSSSSDSEDEIRTDEEEISKTEFVNKVRRRSESSKSSPDFGLEEQAGSPKPKSFAKYDGWTNSRKVREALRDKP